MLPPDTISRKCNARYISSTATEQQSINIKHQQAIAYWCFLRMGCDEVNTPEFQTEALKRLSKVEMSIASIDTSLKNIEDDNRKYQQWLENHERELGGDADVPGLRTRVTRVEDKQEQQSWFNRTLVTTVAGIVGTWFYSLFQNK